MDKGLFTGVVMIDLRKAFDVVDHKLLLKKLQVYGLNTNSLKWFQSYLSGRYQKVCVDGKLYEPLGIHSGVPQGSILGPAGRAPEYLITTLYLLRFEHKYSTRTKTLYRLPKPRTESMRRTFFYSTINDLS